MKLLKAIQNLFASDDRLIRKSYSKGYNDGVRKGRTVGIQDGYEKGWKEAMSTISKVIDEYIYRGQKKG
jgi:flagellar biosynthesis/type III secretory pathway protein FliH